jgi:hypothetical protein
MECHNNDAVPFNLKRRAELDDYAQRYGQHPGTAFDEALAEYCAWKEEDYQALL